MLALSLELNRLGRAHISAGLLTVEDLRSLMMDTCDLGIPEHGSSPDSTAASVPSVDGHLGVSDRLSVTPRSRTRGVRTPIHRPKAQ
jgi:hypothetical protein